MLKLGEAIRAWAPSDGAAGDPRTVLEMVWSEIVGPQIARNSHPTRIAGNSLLVTTRSSGWSHQLSLLSDSIVQAIGARLPSSGIDRLRFRVGTLPESPRAKVLSRPPTRGGRRVGPRAETASAAEALQRFRGQVEQTRDAKRSQGWRPCAACGMLIAPSRVRSCLSCSVAAQDARTRTVAQLMFDAPWLGYRGTAELVEGLQEEEYERIRARLLTRWWGVLTAARDSRRLSSDGRERLIASSYVLLRSNVAPEDIVPATVRGVLGDELHDLIYGK
ncbi:MAG: DUF721 domain-containing protein [Candidatus Eremiobacteraeota bacterium]|nr:DUF721 domain-containing protein [Candidatus Eremiobacteraeota bacterium]